MNHTTSIFSWFREQLDNSEATFQLMNHYQIDRIYQSFTPDIPKKTAKAFLQAAQVYKKDVYWLAGEPEWALEKNRHEIIRYIKSVIPYLPLIKGVVLDIEPYTLEEFKENPKRMMESFAENLSYVYSVAKLYELEVIICLPYYYDNFGFHTELEKIIADALDEVAIMNYYRGKEIEHLRFEAELCLKYQKAIQTIYELQPPGKHGLTDQNTYYHKGLAAVYRNHQTLNKAYPNQYITLAFHEFQFFRKLTKREEG